MAADSDHRRRGDEIGMARQRLAKVHQEYGNDGVAANLQWVNCMKELRKDKMLLAKIKHKTSERHMSLTERHKDMFNKMDKEIARKVTICNVHEQSLPTLKKQRELQTTEIDNRVQEYGWN